MAGAWTGTGLIAVKASAVFSRPQTAIRRLDISIAQEHRDETRQTNQAVGG